MGVPFGQERIRTVETKNILCQGSRCLCFIRIGQFRPLVSSLIGRDKLFVDWLNPNM